MRKRFIVAALAAIFIIALPASAQGPANAPPPTNVFGTILDPTGVPYNTGFIRFDLVPSGGPVPCVGTPCTSINGHYGNVYLDGNGHFQMNLYPNSLITPAGTQWQITVSEPGDPAPWCFGPQSFTTAITVTNTSTMDVSATLSALAPQLCRNGNAGGAISIQHNGVLVGTEPILNLIDSASVTLAVTNDVANTRIDATPTGIAGTGCTLPGINTGVLSEHPAGTCFDSLDWTWDDGVSKQLMQAGKSNTVGTQDTYSFGNSNNLSSDVQSFALGVSNDMHSTNLSGSGDQYKFSIGAFNNQVGVTQDGYVLGDSNNLSFSAGGASQVYVIGHGLAATGVAAPFQGVSSGISNTLSMTHAGGSLANFGFYGDLNTITESAGGSGLKFVYEYGRTNRIKDTLGSSTAFAGLYGFDNESDGIDAQDIAIYGQSNTVHALQSCFTGLCNGLAQDSTVFGNQITMTNVGTGLAAGINVALTNCTGCMAVGYNISSSASNTLAMGVNGPGEIQVAPTSSGAAGSMQIALDLNDFGVVVNKVVKLSGAPSGAIVSATGDTNGFVGIAVATAAGAAQVAVIGTASCIFDGATTAGDYVQNSSGTGGDCHDAGASYPGTGQVLGRVLSTNGAGGTYKILIFPPSR